MDYIFKSSSAAVMAAVSGVPGVKVVGDSCHVPEGIKTLAEAVAERAAKGYRHSSEIKKGYKPSVDDETMIKLITGDDEIMERVAVYRVEACNTILDKENERFTPSVLTIAANQVQKSNNVPVLFNHNPDNLIGRVFDAYVEPIPGVDGQFRLMSKMYVLRSAMMPNGTGMTVAEAVDAGILNMTSIGIMVDNTQWKEVGEGRYERILDGTPDGTVYLEQSMVWHGAQNGAMVKGIDKAEIDYTFTPKPVKKMTEIEIKGMKLTITDESVTGVDAIEKAIGDRDSRIAELEATIKGIKKPLVDEAMTLHKEIGTITEATEGGLYELSIEALTEHLTNLRKAANPGSPVQPVEPAKSEPAKPKYY